MQSMRKKHPLELTIFGLLVFGFATWNGLRLCAAISAWKVLAEYGAHPLYIAISGGVWLGSGLLLDWGLWQGKAWAWMAAIGDATGYGSWYWIDRLVFQRPRANWPFALAATIIIFIFVLFVLTTHGTRRFFQRDNHERKSKNSASA